MSAWEWLFVHLFVSGSVSVSEISEQFELEILFSVQKQIFTIYMSSLIPKVLMLINCQNSGVSGPTT